MSALQPAAAQGGRPAVVLDQPDEVERLDLADRGRREGAVDDRDAVDTSGDLEAAAFQLVDVPALGERDDNGNLTIWLAALGLAQVPGQFHVDLGAHGF